jgi:hypothetical protein
LQSGELKCTEMFAWYRCKTSYLNQMCLPDCMQEKRCRKNEIRNSIRWERCGFLLCKRLTFAQHLLLLFRVAHLLVTVGQ